MILFLGSKREIFALYALSILLVLFLSSLLFFSGYSYQESAPEEGVSLFLYVLVATGIFLVLLRFRRLLQLLLLLLEASFLFLSAYTYLSIFLPDVSAFFGAATLAWARLAFRFSRRVRNISALLIATWAAAFIGVLFHPIPLIVFGAVMAAYDVFAVFVTKHMVKLVEGIGLKPGGELIGLGGGDVVVPLAIMASLLGISEYVAIFSGIGAVLGLLFTIYLASRRRPLPALPSILFPQFFFTLLALLLSP